MISLIYILLGISFALFVYIFCRKTRRLPPGPFGIPLLGYLPWLDPERPHLSLTNVARKYGPICGLRMGSVYTILLSDPQLVRQAFAKDALAGRAPLYLTHGIMQGYGECNFLYFAINKIIYLRVNIHIYTFSLYLN